MAALAGATTTVKHADAAPAGGCGATRPVTGRLLLPPLLDVGGKPRHVSSLATTAKPLPKYPPLSTRHQSKTFGFGSAEPACLDSEILYFERILSRIHGVVFAEASSTAMAGIFRVRDALSYLKNDMVPSLIRLEEDSESPADLVASAKKTLAKARVLLCKVEEDLPFDPASMKACASHFKYLEKIEALDATFFDFLNQIREPLKEISDDSIIPQPYLDNILSIFEKTLLLENELFATLEMSRKGKLNFFDDDEVPNLEIAACRAYILSNKIFKELYAIADYTQTLAASKSLKAPDHLEELREKAKVASENSMVRYSEVLSGIKETNPKAAEELKAVESMYQDLVSDAIGVLD